MALAFCASGAKAQEHNSPKRTQDKSDARDLDSVIEPYRVTKISSKFVDEDGTIASLITVALVEDPQGEPADLGIVIRDRLEGGTATETLTFQRKGDSKTFAVYGSDDSEVDGNQPFAVHFSYGSSGAWNSTSDINVKLPDPVRLTNLDNEYGVVVEDPGMVLEVARDWIRVPIHLSRRPSSSVLLRPRTLTPSICRIRQCDNKPLSADMRPSNLLVDILDNEVESDRVEECRIALTLRSQDRNFDGITQEFTIKILDDEATFAVDTSKAAELGWSLSANPEGETKITFNEFRPQVRQDANIPVITTAQPPETDKFLELRTLQIIFTSSFARSFTHDQISRAKSEYQTALAQLDQASRGSLRASGKTLTLRTTLRVEDFIYCGETSSDCLENEILLNTAAQDKIWQALRDRDINPYNFDAIQLTIPFDDFDGARRLSFQGSPFWSLSQQSNARGWTKDRVSVYALDFGQYYSSEYVGENLLHTLEPSLREAARAQQASPRLVGINENITSLSTDYVTYNSEFAYRLGTKLVGKPSAEVTLGQAGNAKVVGAGDLTGDGKAELVLKIKGSLTSYLTVWKLSSSLAIQDRIGVLDEIGDLTINGMTDLNGDGLADLPYQEPGPFNSPRSRVGFMDLTEQPVRFKFIAESDSGWRYVGCGEIPRNDSSGRNDKVLFFEEEAIVPSGILRYWNIRDGRLHAKLQTSIAADVDTEVLFVGDISGDSYADIIAPVAFGTAVWILGESARTQQTRPFGISRVGAVGNLNGPDDPIPFWNSLVHGGDISTADPVVKGWDPFEEGRLWPFAFFHSSLWPELSQVSSTPKGITRPGDRVYSIDSSGSRNLRYTAESKARFNTADFDPEICSVSEDMPTPAPALPAWLSGFTMLGLGLMRGRLRLPSTDA